VRFTLSEPATVALAVQRTTRGYRSGKQCVTRRPKTKSVRRCSRTSTLGTIRLPRRPAGAAKTTFTGRVGGRALKPGPYRLAVTATDDARNRSTTKTTNFTIARR